MSGFFAPPLSTLVVMSFVIVSSSLLRPLVPGPQSQYCLTMIAAKPDTPPKYWQSFSTSSALWGMFDPPAIASLVYRSTPADSMSSSFDRRFSFAR